jgi:cytochrome c biogenesis factor
MSGNSAIIARSCVFYAVLFEANQIVKLEYGMYTVTVTELRAVLKEVSAQAGQNSVENKAPVESTTQDDDVQEVKGSKIRISNDTSEAANKSAKPLPKSAAVKLQPK